MELKKITTLVLLLSTFCFLFSGFVFAQSNVPACPALSRGSQGECVRFLQRSLNTLINSGLVVDGIFGPLTESAVRTFQGQKGIRVDGVVGAQTWSAISQGLTQPGYSLPPLPPGVGQTAGSLGGILINFANFLIGAGVVVAIIVIVWSGIMYFRAGSDTEAKSAKGWFRNGIIGAFIILGVGVIILTIYNIVVTQSFFGIGPGGGPGPGPGSGPGQGSPGTSCITSNDCSLGLNCNLSTGICIRIGGNVEGESCKDNSDCKSSLDCKRTGIFGTGPKQCKNP